MEAEQSLLGGLLIDNLVWDAVADIASGGDLYRYEHRKPADVIPVYDQIERTSASHGNDCGGLAYLNALAQSVPSASNARRYAEIVRERSVRKPRPRGGEFV